MTRPIIIALLAAATLTAQQPNGTFSSLNINGPASATVAAPSLTRTFTDSVVDVRVQGFPEPDPVLLLGAVAVEDGGSLSLGAVNIADFALDLADTGNPGYGDQILVDGFSFPGPNSTTNASGEYGFSLMVPSCVATNGALPCLETTIEVSFQALVSDPSALFNVRSTGAGRARLLNGGQEFALSGDQAAIFLFRDGFTFDFYGTTYTRAWISANGYVSFTQAPTGFPSPTPNDIAFGPPRIMSFYNDLQPEIQVTSPRIYAQQFEENGTRKLRIVHERLAEFGNFTGPHGGEITMTENGEVAVLVAPYNGLPSIATGVGITPGGGLDPVPFGQFGRDLTADIASGPTVLGAGKLGFELFEVIGPNTNIMDVIGVGLNNGSDVGPGIVYRPDPTLPNTDPLTSGYVIDP